MSVAEAKAMSEREALVLTIALGEAKGRTFHYDIYDAQLRGVKAAMNHPLWSDPQEKLGEEP